MDQKHFRSILRKYLQGQATDEEEKMIDSWYADMGKDINSFMGQDESELENRYWSSITAHIRRKKREIAHHTVISWNWIGMAASVLVAMVSYLYVTHYVTAKENPIAIQYHETVKWKEISNDGESQRLIILPDDSKVTLEPQSQLRFAASFEGMERAVYLDGEAFFEVTRNEKRPFLVHTNKLTTKVLGTSFTVKAFQQQKEVIVLVKTGKVSVYTNAETNKYETGTGEVILTPNQKIVYHKSENKLSRMIVDSPQAILPPEEVEKMRFEAAPVSEIFQAIEKVYGVNLVFDEEKFSGCTLTSVISDGELYNRMDIICKAIGAGYRVEENEIIIDGDGCKNQ